MNSKLQEKMAIIFSKDSNVTETMLSEIINIEKEMNELIESKYVLKCLQLIEKLIIVIKDTAKHHEEDEIIIKNYILIIERAYENSSQNDFILKSEFHGESNKNEYVNIKKSGNLVRSYIHGTFTSFELKMFLNKSMLNFVIKNDESLDIFKEKFLQIFIGDEHLKLINFYKLNKEINKKENEKITKRIKI